MAQLLHLFQGDPTVTSSPSEVRVWIEELDCSFLVYGRNFERAEINGERLLNITWQELTEVGVIRTDHQDIILKAVAGIHKKNKVEEQAMQGGQQNDKKMPTRFRKQSEHLEHAVDRVFVMISERRRARSLHGTDEQPPHNILTAALELINVVKMILNILERPPFDRNAEFSSLKNHLIKHITLLKHFSEQSDLSHEMESDMIDVCKGVTKICHYIISLPPDSPEPETQALEYITPEERPPRVQVPIITETEVKSFSMEYVPDYIPPTQRPSMPITTTSPSSEPVFPLQAVTPPNERIPGRFEYLCPESLNNPSNEGAVMMPHDEGNKSETEVSETKGSETSAGSLNYKSFQDLTIIESDTPLVDSGSERCVIDSDSDRGIGLDSDLEQHSKDSDSVIWRMDSDSEKHPMDSGSVKHLLEKHQMVSGCMEDLTESQHHLVGVEQCQVDFGSLKHQTDSDSEKCLVGSDSEKRVVDSDSDSPGIDSDSEESPMASASMKRLLQAEKHQMASDSVKRLMESEEGLTQAEKHWMMSASETYVIDSDMEGGGMDSASAYRVQLMGEERYQKKTRSKRYVMDSDSEPCETDSDSERCGLASAAVKCLRDVKPFQLSTDTKERRKDSWSERCTADLDSECLGMASDSVKHKKKAENCQRTSDLKRFWMRLRSASERCWMDSKRKQLDFEYGRCWDSSRRYQLKPARLQFGSGRYRGDFQKHRYNFERHRVDSDSEKCQTDSENERHQNEFESERHLMEVEREQCLTQIEDKILQMNEERERRLIESDSEKECRIAFDSERHRLESENEAQRLGARRKDNRPQGFWRPVFLPPSPVHQKETEEQRSVQKIDGRDVSRIQLVRYLSDDKSVRFKKVSPTLNDKQDPQQKLKENYSHNLPSDSDASMDNKHRSITRRKISVRKSRRKDYRYPQSSQSSGSQINSVLPLSAEGHTPKASPPVCHTTSMSPRSAVSSKTLRNSTHSLDTGVKICSRCFVEINNSSFHKCLKSFYDDSDPDSPLHPQVPLDSKYSLSLKSVRHHKTSRNSPLFRSLDPKQPVGIRCPLHRDESKYSLGSTSYLHCESCSALQNLKGSTVTRTFLINPQNTISRRSTPGPDNIINTSSVTGPEDGDKFNLAAKLKDEANRDNESKCVGYTNLKDEANAKDESLPKDETDLEEETNSENETNPEDETDSEDEDSPKDKKDPKDKSDPDDTDPKDDSNAENDDDTNSGADPSGDADPTSGANSNNDGDPNNGTDPTSEPDPDTDRATNNDANSERSTDPDGETHTRSDNGAHIDSGVDQDYTADFKNGTNPSYISECQNGKGLDCIPGSKNDAGPSNDTGTGNDICPHNGTGPNCGSGPNNGLVSNNNEPGYDINGLGLQNNGSGPQNIRLDPNNPGSNNNVPDPNNIGLGPNNIPDSNHNSPGPNNTNPGPPKSLDSSYTARPSNAISPDNSADPNYDTRPISTAGHNYSPVPNYYSDLDYVPEFTHEAGSSFVVNPNYIARNSYVAKLSSAASIVNATDPSNDTNCSGVISPSYTASTNYASDDNHVLVFTHATGSNFVINPVYNAINAHNSSSIGNIHNLSKPKLEISSSFSVSHTVYGNSSTFDVGTIYSSNPDNLSTSKFSDPSKLGRNYTIFDDHTFGAHLKDSAGSKKSSSFKHATESKDVLDANESGFLKNFSRIQNPIGIKDPARLNFHTKPNILLHSFGIIIEAEPADVVKFAISSGAMNQFFKSLHNYGDALRPERGTMEGAMERTTGRSSERPAGGTAQGPEGGPTRRLLVSPVRGYAVSPASGHAISPARGYAERHAKGQNVSPARDHVVRPVEGSAVNPARRPAVSPARGQAMSPARGLTVRPESGRDVSPARGHAERHARGHTVRPSRAHDVSPAKGLAVNPARGQGMNPAGRLTVRPDGAHAVGPTRRYAVSPARGWSVSPARGLTVTFERGHVVSPARGRAVSSTRGQGVSPSRGPTVEPERKYFVNPAREYAERQPKQHVVSTAQGLTLGPRADRLVLGPAVGLTVKPAEGSSGESFGRSARRFGRSATDRNQNRGRFSILTAITNFVMKAKAQNWFNSSWFRRVLCSFFSEEDQFFWSRTRFCAMACTELGHGKCEGWLWKKRESTGISFFSWKRHWFILKQSTLYWFSHLNDTKADGFIYLPEFRIDLAPHCRKNNAFQASHARIKSFYFAAGCSDEMNYWVGQMLQLAYGSSFGDAAANEEYRRLGAVIYANCVLALTREFPVIWCNTCHQPTTIVSVSPTFQYRGAQDVSDEFIYFRPVDEEVREEARRQTQQKSTITSHRHTREEYSRPRTPRNLWLVSPENTESSGSDELEVDRRRYRYGERRIVRRSWEELLEAPLNSEGLHILQTIPTEERQNGYLRLPLEEENRAITAPRGHHSHALQGPFPLLPQRPKLQRQRSKSLPRYSDVKSRKLKEPELTLSPEGAHFFSPSDHNLLRGAKPKQRRSIEKGSQKAISSASGEYPSISPTLDISSVRRGELGVPGDNAGLLRGNVRVPRHHASISIGNVGVHMGNSGVPRGTVGVPRGTVGVPRGTVGVLMDNPGVPRGNGGIPMGSVGVPIDDVVTFRHNVGTSRHTFISALTELSKIGEHQV